MGNGIRRIKGYINMDIDMVDKDGFVHTIRRKTIKEVYDELCARLKFEDMFPDEYFEISASIKYKYETGKEKENAPFPEFRFIACYPVTGGSEGHYIHIDVVKDGKHEPIFLGKTFKGFERACEIANACSRHLGA